MTLQHGAYRRPIRPSISKILAYCVLVAGALGCAAPFFLMIATSLMHYKQTLAYPPRWLPHPATLANYQAAFTTSSLLRYLANSALVALCTVTGQLLTASMAGYAFARLKFPGRDALFIVVLATMMVPVQVNLVPLFALVAQLGWVDTYWALIVPDLAGALGVFVFRQWFLNLPTELEDAARIDGCSPWQFFWRIAMPTAAPAIATLGIFQFLASWNTFLWPLVATNSDAMRTLPVGLAAIQASMHETTRWSLLMAATTVAIVPAVLVFLALQRYFVKGLLEGAVKG